MSRSRRLYMTPWVSQTSSHFSTTGTDRKLERPLLRPSTTSVPSFAPGPSKAVYEDEVSTFVVPQPPDSRSFLVSSLYSVGARPNYSIGTLRWLSSVQMFGRVITPSCRVSASIYLSPVGGGRLAFLSRSYPSPSASWAFNIVLAAVSSTVFLTLPDLRPALLRFGVHAFASRGTKECAQLFRCFGSGASIKISSGTITRCS